MTKPRVEPSGNDAKASWWVTTVAILWAFLGVRRKSDFEKDIGRLSPMQIAIVGSIAGVALVLILVAIVAWVAGDMPNAAPI